MLSNGISNGSISNNDIKNGKADIYDEIWTKSHSKGNDEAIIISNAIGISDDFGHFNSIHNIDL